jgi:hypothetical protein
VAASGDLHFDLSPKTQIVTGLEFQSAKYSYQDYSGTWPNEIDSNAVYHPDLNWFDLQYSLLFLGVPVRLKVKLNSPEKSNHFFLEGGFIFDTGWILAAMYH